MIHGEGSSLSPGAWVGIPLLILGLIVLALLTWLTVRWTLKGEDDAWLGWLVGGVVFLAVGLGAVAYYPFSSDFHRYYQVTGTVQEAKSRLISNGDGGMQERYAVKLAESGQTFGVDDSRASLLKAGDPVDLRCKRDFEFNSVPGWACHWNQG